MPAANSMTRVHSITVAMQCACLSTSSFIATCWAALHAAHSQQHLESWTAVPRPPTGLEWHSCRVIRGPRQA